MKNMKKTVLVLGGGGFIGGHLAKRLKEEGNYVLVCDLKFHEYFDPEQIADEYQILDLTDPLHVEKAIPQDCDEVYQLAADMGGAEYLFSGLNDANVECNEFLCFDQSPCGA